MTSPRYVESGQRLYAARKAAGLTQVQVAELTGISRNVQSNMENGRIGIGPVRAAKLSTALGVPADTLLSDRPLSELERRQRHDLERRLDAVERRLRELAEDSIP